MAKDPSKTKLLPEATRIMKRMQIGRLFTPETPINEANLFAGRRKQIGTILDAIIRVGQHVVIYGERGVGKTSLANCLVGFLNVPQARFIAPRAICDSESTFSSVWRSIFDQMTLVQNIDKMGLRPESDEIPIPLSEALNIPDKITPDVVRVAMSQLADRQTTIIIIDEFDRFTDRAQARLFADTIKILSDYAIPCTIVIVGVSATVDGLIQGHESILRNLVQVPIPRMSVEESREIITSRLPQAGLTIQSAATDKICLLSKGLPHYTHLLALESALEVVEEGGKSITIEHVKKATARAIERSQQSVQSAYHVATMSSRDESLYGEVLLACALAECDEFGYFTAGDLRQPLSVVTGKSYEIPSYSRHLKSFCEDIRGRILEQIGEKYQRRFRFHNPLMQPYVVMRGIAKCQVTLEAVEQLSTMSRIDEGKDATASTQET